jgi:hypothetical protein
MEQIFIEEEVQQPFFFVALLTIITFSENILYKHSGIFFVAVFVLFSYSQKSCSKKTFRFEHLANNN